MISKKVTDNRKKNPTRIIDKWVAQDVKIRDSVCIICTNPITQIHHVWFWGEKQLDTWRNGVDRLVGLCNECHHELHFGIKNLGYREFTKKYLKSIYGNNT
jgi:hypothetical protein